jgi:hypothetical protein
MIEDTKHVALTNKERKTLLHLYSGLVELQASALYYVSEGLDNAEKARRAETVTVELLAFRKKSLGDPCSAGMVPCPDGGCAPPGGCGPTAFHKSPPKGGKDD